jgi:hypothetical protein
MAVSKRVNCFAAVRVGRSFIFNRCAPCAPALIRPLMELKRLPFQVHQYDAHGLLIIAQIRNHEYVSC